MPDINIDNVEYTIEINPTPTYEINLNAQGPQGAQGVQGVPGQDGTDGQDAQAATISVGTVSTGAAGTEATVVNSGTSSAAVFDFVIPKGDKGAT